MPEREIEPPIDIVPNADPHRVGASQARLHQAGVEDAYRQLGLTVSTRYEVKTLADGSKRVHIIETTN